MPYGTTAGVYTANLTAGTEVSSTYEGRYLTFLASELHGPNALIVHGDPVFVDNLIGDIVGVAMTSQHATDDNLITIDTEGIWNLSVIATDAWGAGVDIVAGDALYIQHIDGAAAITRNHDPEDGILFGYALGAVASGQTAVIAVKVHWGPHEDYIWMGIVTNYTTATSGRARARIDSDYSALTGNHNGLDVRCGATAAGEAIPIVRAIHGYAFQSGVRTAIGGWNLLTGVAGLMSLNGTVDNSTGFYTGGFFQAMEGGGTLTEVSHMCALWADFACSTLPTTRGGGAGHAGQGGCEILYLTCNQAVALDSAIHIKLFPDEDCIGANAMFFFETCYFGGASGTPIRDGGTGDKTVETGGKWLKMNVSVDGTEYWIVLMTDPTESA